MIIKLHKFTKDAEGYKVSYSFRLEDGTEIGSAINNNDNQPIYFWLNEEKYTLPRDLKIVPRLPSNFKYPCSGKYKKIPGWIIYDENQNSIAYYHSEALTVGRVWKTFLKRNVSTTAIVYKEELHYLFQVGFLGQSDHYYCLYRGNELIGEMERHMLTTKNPDCIATIYIEKEENMLINLLAAVEELIYVQTYDGGYDTSACGYISRYEEERLLFDKNYIERVKTSNNK